MIAAARLGFNGFALTATTTGPTFLPIHKQNPCRPANQ